MSEQIYCPTDIAVALGSYACAVKFGQYSAATCPPTLPIDRLIPGRQSRSQMIWAFAYITGVFCLIIRKQYDHTDDQWYDSIIAFYKEYQYNGRESAMIDYLRMAQDLDMYGVEFFQITNKKNTELLLGVYALGLSIYEPSNRYICHQYINAFFVCPNMPSRSFLGSILRLVFLGPKSAIYHSKIGNFTLNQLTKIQRYAHQEM